MPQRAFHISQDVVDRYLSDCYEKEEQPHVSELAERLGVSRVTLNRKFKNCYGISVSEYFARHRHSMAKQLLAHADMTTERIATKAGYGTSRTFARSFQTRGGATPAEFRAGQKRTRE